MRFDTNINKSYLSIRIWKNRLHDGNLFSRTQCVKRLTVITWTWKLQTLKKVYLTEYNFAHCATAVSKNYWVVWRPLVRCMCTACIRATNQVREYISAVSLSIPCLCLLALKFRIWELSHGYHCALVMWIMKQNLHAIADTKCQYFQTNLWLGQVYMQNWTCIAQLW